MMFFVVAILITGCIYVHFFCHFIDYVCSLNVKHGVFHKKTYLLWLVVFSNHSQTLAISSVFVNGHSHQETLELSPTAYVDRS